jgi:hypothetical protein
MTPESVTEEAEQQVMQLRQNADDMLLQLMLEQKAKLNSMIQQLKSAPEGTQPSLSTSSQSEKQNQPSFSSNEATDAPLESKVPLDEVSHLQNKNLVHLDTIVSRINDTMNSGSPQTTNAENEMRERGNNDKPEANI